jgi:Cof subfamily protein (haloacid dehalogenase superfamily)
MDTKENKVDKIVFFDIDGTLLDKNNQIPPSTKEAINLLKENGVSVAIATGRAPTIFDAIRQELGIETFVCCNGSFAVFEGDVVYKHSLELSEIGSLQESANDLTHPMIFANCEGIWTNAENHPQIQQCMKDLNIKYPKYLPMLDDQSEILYALLFCEEDQEEYYKKTHTWFDFIRWHKYSMDVIPHGGSKAKGIEVLLERLNIPRENSYAFGDGINDLEMLEYVGTGIAMGNGKKEAKEMADFVTKDVSDDGIYYGLKKLGLI